jgi:site-specific DNA-methyltransferase (adenine-specific)
MGVYFADAAVTLYLGDMREIVPALEETVDCIVTDPPYAETTLGWDRWPIGWPSVAATATRSMWCFGSMRMFLERHAEFALWRMSQDVVWEKHNGSSFAKDRFKRVHEHATHWYLGAWSDVHRDVPRVPRTGPAKAVKNRTSTPHTGAISGGAYVDDGLRLARSVLQFRSMHGRAIHPTEKPVELLDMLIRYACPAGGIVLDPFAGSGSTAVAARASGRRAVLIEADERYCEAIAKRLSQGVFELAGMATGSKATTEEEKA